MPRNPVPPVLTLQLDHSDLALQHQRGTLHDTVYADEVVARAQAAYPFLEFVADRHILRLVPDLPRSVMTCRDGQGYASAVVTFLDLAGDGATLEARLVFQADMFVVSLFGFDEYLVLEPHADPAHPGRRYAAWLTELPEGDIDDRSLGPWFAATPQAALAMACDYLQQFALGEPHPKEL